MKSRSPKEILLRRGFFDRPSLDVAPDLLGKILVHRDEGAILSGRIVETEAYLGLDDPASHAYAGRTPANGVLFGRTGLAHVYLIYGLHHCLSISAHAKGHAGGVLIRALLPLQGTDRMSQLRGKPGKIDARWLTGGPGRICQAFGIERSTHNGLDVTAKASTIWVADDGFECGAITVTKRIGITKAVDDPLRFVCDSVASVGQLRAPTKLSLEIPPREA
jgi:DNA-3-methyladenine glycosylase